jgi:hypothetical protein
LEIEDDTMPLLNSLRNPAVRAWWFYVPVLAAFAVVTCAIWAPFGWRISGTFEEWAVMVRADQLGTLSQLVVYPLNRPLFQAPMAIAHWLTPGSFLGMNILQALFIFGTSAAMFWLVLSLTPRNYAVAFVAATLLLVYPADDATYTLRTVNIHAGALFLVISLCLLTLSIRRTTWLRIAAMIAMLTLSLAIYDGGLLIAFFAPALIFCMRTPFSRRTAFVSAAWWVAPIAFAYALWLMVQNPATYQGGLIRTAGLGQDYAHTASVLARSIWRSLMQNFWSGWIQAATPPHYDDLYFRIVAALAAFVFVPVVWALCRTAQNELRLPATDQRYWVMAISGVAIAVLGFAMFLPTSYRDTNWRIFIYSAVGASLTVAVLCRVTASLFRPAAKFVFVTLSVALFVVGGVHAIGQQGRYFAQTQRQQAILAGIVAAAPKVVSPVAFLLIDTTPTAAYKAWSMCSQISDCLQDQLRYLYHGVELQAAYCAPQFLPRGISSEVCNFEQYGVAITYDYLLNGRPVRRFFPYGSLLIFENGSDGVRLLDDLRDYVHVEIASKYDPRSIVSIGASPPPRVHTLFTRWPFKPTDPRRRIESSYRFDFDHPAAGEGWSSPEQSRMWTTAPESTLDFWLQDDADYSMQFRVVAAMAPDIMSSLHVTVNDRPMALVRHPDVGGAATFTARIPAATVAADATNTRVTFTVNRVVTPKSLGMNADERTLGLMFDWIRIDPIRSR